MRAPILKNDSNKNYVQQGVEALRNTSVWKQLDNIDVDKITLDEYKALLKKGCNFLDHISIKEMKSEII